jgi:hypothetical protein
MSKQANFRDLQIICFKLKQIPFILDFKSFEASQFRASNILKQALQIEANPIQEARTSKSLKQAILRLYFEAHLQKSGIQRLGKDKANPNKKQSVHTNLFLKKR